MFMEIYQIKNSELLEQHLKVEKLCREIMRKYWKNKTLLLTTLDTLNSTMDMIGYYENEIKNGNP